MPARSARPLVTLAAIGCLLTTSVPLRAEQRVALIIGNGGYENAEHLSNPPHDATEIAHALAAYGFATTLQINVGRKALRTLIEDFGRTLGPDTVALFYYSGHGVQTAGVNYMIPIDAEIHSDADVESDGVSVNYALQTMEGAHAPTNIIILDACRNDPFQTGHKSLSKGLAPMNPPNGTLIAYAASPGQVAENGPDGGYSPFTDILLQTLPESNLTALDMFNQVSAAVSAQSHSHQRPFMEISSFPRFSFSRTPPSPTEHVGPNPDTAARVSPHDVREATYTIAGPTSPYRTFQVDDYIHVTLDAKDLGAFGPQIGVGTRHGALQNPIVVFNAKPGQTLRIEAFDWGGAYVLGPIILYKNGETPRKLTDGIPTCSLDHLRCPTHPDTCNSVGCDASKASVFFMQTYPLP